MTIDHSAANGDAPTTAMSAIEVRAFILGELTEPLRALGMGPADVPDDFDLLSSGVIDSLGIVTMVVAIEDRYAVTLDDLDVDALTNVDRLAEYVVSKSVAG